MHDRLGMNRLLILSLLLVACGSPPAQTQKPLPSAVDVPDPLTVTWTDLQAQVASGECKVDRHCGALSFVNCRIEADGPGYYVDDSQRRIVAVCGGACMLPTEGHCAECPPAAWTCPE